MEANEQIEYVKEAFKLKEKKYYKPAIEVLYKALELENDNIEILFQISELYFLLNNYEHSMKYIEKVLSLNPVYEPGLILIIKLDERLGDLDGALKFSQILYENYNNENNLAILVKILLKLKLYPEVEKYSELLNDDLKIEYANALYVDGLGDEAKGILSQCDKNNENALLLEGKIKFDEGDLDRSQEIFNRISVNSQNPEILNFLGLFELEKMNFVEAVKHFSKAVSLDKNTSKYFYNLGCAYFYNGWIKEAKNAYSKALYLNPDNTGYRYSLAYLYFDNKEFSKSRKEVDAILDLEPENTQAIVLRALLLANDKDYLGAKELLETCIEKSNDDFAKVSLSKIYAQLNIFEKAEKLLISVIEKNPRNLNYLCDLSEIYIKERKYDKSINIANKILEINPNYIAAYILAARSAYLNDDFELTKKYSQDALALDINCASGYYYLALSREKTNDLEEAIECMKRAILYDLNNSEYYAKMSEFYAMKEDFKTALDYISEAVNLDNTNKYKFAYSQLVKLNRKKIKN